MDNRRDNLVNHPRSASYPNRQLVVPARSASRKGPVIDVVKPSAKAPAAPVATQPQPALMPDAPVLPRSPAQPAPAKPELGQSAPKKAIKHKRAKNSKGWPKWRRILFNLLIIGLLLAAAYMIYDTWRTNSEVKQSLTDTTQAVNGSKQIAAAVGDGKDTTPLPANTLANYKVAADLPRAIYIDKLGVAARLLPMSVNQDNSMQAPNNIYDAGWYNGSSKPGQAGAMVVDGHASQTGTHYGLFGRLDSLANGDKITVERGDGTKLTFAVAKVETVPLDKVDMSQVMVPYGSSGQGLNLITCAGDWTKDGKTLDHRVIVYAVPVA